jgi:hypothetical protein
MKAKDKAKELVDKFLQYTPAEEEYEYPYAKQCALIAVDEILLNCYEVMKPFWEEVKQEIEKL